MYFDGRRCHPPGAARQGRTGLALGAIPRHRTRVPGLPCRLAQRPPHHRSQIVPGATPWAATKRSLIAQAYQQAARADAAPGADAAYRREKRLRREGFFWKQATNVNTIDAYRDYLHEYPLGQFTAQALSQIKKINPAAPELTPPR